jgi:hypothetical protein
MVRDVAKFLVLIFGRNVLRNFHIFSDRIFFQFFLKIFITRFFSQDFFSEIKGTQIFLKTQHGNFLGNFNFGGIFHFVKIKGTQIILKTRWRFFKCIFFFHFIKGTQTFLKTQPFSNLEVPGFLRKHKLS